MSGSSELNASSLRQLEVEGYSGVISALFAQGELTWRKEQLLQEIRWALRIPDDLHQREMQRVHSDSMLGQIRQNSAKDVYFPGVKPSDPANNQEDFTANKPLNAFPAATTLKGQPLSVPGNVITRPKETPQPEKKKKLQKRTPVRPKKSSPSSTQDSIAPLPMPSQKSKEEDASPNILQLQQEKEKLEQEKAKIAQELAEIERSSLQLQEEEDDEEEMEIDASDE